jgi:hypothetical protein
MGRAWEPGFTEDAGVSLRCMSLLLARTVVAAGHHFGSDPTLTGHAIGAVDPTFLTRSGRDRAPQQQRRCDFRERNRRKCAFGDPPGRSRADSPASRNAQHLDSRLPLWVTLRRLGMSALAAAFLESSHSGDFASKEAGDDGVLIWLKDNSGTNTQAAVNALKNFQKTQGDTGIRTFLFGPALAAMFQDPAHNSRAPDIIGITRVGVI